MQQMVSYLRKVLSAKYAGILVIAICLLAKSVLICYYSYIGRDKMYHLSASHNLLHGKGWTNSFYYSDQLDREVHESFCLWPPGYGILVVPVAYLLNDDLRLSTDVLEILFFCIFLLLCRRILRSQHMSESWINVSTFMLAFYPHNFIEVSFGTDLPGLCWMLAYFYAIIVMWTASKSSRAIWWGIAAALCLFMAGYTRYMYVPVAVFISACMIALAHWKKNNIPVKGYWLSFILSALLLTAAALYQGASCDDPFYIGTKEKSLFVSNLEYWYPAALDAFMNTAIVSTFLEKITGIPFRTWHIVFGWINLAVYLCIMLAAIRYWQRIKNETAKKNPVFKAVGFVLSLAIIGEMALLSLTNSPKYEMSGRAWTFIVEGRYQAFAVVFLQLFFFLELSRLIKGDYAGKFQALLLRGLLILFCVTSLHQVYFTAKVALRYKQMKREVIREQDYVFGAEYMRALKDSSTGKEILVTSSDAYYPMMASVIGLKGVKDYQHAHLIYSKVTRPSVLVVVIMKPQLPLYREFLEQPGVRLVKEINGTYIYRQDIR